MFTSEMSPFSEWSFHYSANITAIKNYENKFQVTLSYKTTHNSLNVRNVNSDFHKTVGTDFAGHALIDLV